MYISESGYFNKCGGNG